MIGIAILGKKRLLWPVVGCIASTVTIFAEAQEPDGLNTNGTQWRLGVMGTLSDDAYVDADNSIGIYPLIFFESQRFFFHATEGGVHLYKGDQFTLDATLVIGSLNMDPDDLGREALASRNVDRGQLDDRDRSYYAGLSASWASRFGVLSAEAHADISGTSEGERYDVGYKYPWNIGRARVTPHIGVTYLSENVADYYYGIDTDESITGDYSYIPDAALLSGVGVDLAYSLSHDWNIYATLDYESYPDEIADSPLIEDDAAVRLRTGVSYSF